MKNLLNFFLKYNYWFLFVLLEIISFALLFRFNSYQGSAFFTSANFVSGAMYDAANNVTGYFHLKTINDELVQKNVELELQLESIRKALIEATEDSSGVEQLKQEALAGYDIFKASVINNSVTHADNYITLDKGEADGIRSEMGVVNGSGVVGIVYLTSPHYSIVIPVLNSKSSISCKIKRSDYFGFLKWDGGSSEFAFIKDMPRHSLFSLGDTIVTSGHSAVFPSGIPVGTVDDIADSHDGLSYLLRVKLFTDFARLNDVRVCDLELIENPPRKQEQPELPLLKNNEQRAAFIDAFETWPLWIETEQTGERYYRYDLEDGTSMVVKVYHARIFDGYASGSYEARYHDGYGRHEYYLLRDGKFFRDCETNRSALIEKLKEIQKMKKG